MKLVVSRVNLVRKDGLVIYDPADLIDEGGSRRDLFGLGQALRARLSIADSLSQHLAPFSLRLPRFPRESRFLPVNHMRHVGMPRGKAMPR